MSWILITGSTSHLGKEIALHLAQSGKNIILHYHNHLELAEQIAKEIEVIGRQTQVLQGDFSSQSGVHDFLQDYKKLTIQVESVINNVGPYMQKSLLHSSIEDLQSVFQTNFFASVSIVKALLPDLQKTKGSIIYLGFPALSRGKVRRVAPGYALAKETLFVWMRSFAKELLPFDVTVNMVSPGYIERSVDLPEASTLPQSRYVSCSEIATLVQYLTSPASRSITGQNIDVAGGVGL